MNLEEIQLLLYEQLKYIFQSIEINVENNHVLQNQQLYCYIKKNAINNLKKTDFIIMQNHAKINFNLELIAIINIYTEWIQWKYSILINESVKEQYEKFKTIFFDLIAIKIYHVLLLYEKYHIIYPYNSIQSYNDNYVSINLGDKKAFIHTEIPFTDPLMTNNIKLFTKNNQCFIEEFGYAIKNISLNEASELIGKEIIHKHDIIKENEKFEKNLIRQKNYTITFDDLNDFNWVCNYFPKDMLLDLNENTISRINAMIYAININKNLTLNNYFDNAIEIVPLFNNINSHIVQNLGTNTNISHYSIDDNPKNYSAFSKNILILSSYNYTSYRINLFKEFKQIQLGCIKNNEYEKYGILFLQDKKDESKYNIKVFLNMGTNNASIVFASIFSNYKQIII